MKNKIKSMPIPIIAFISALLLVFILCLVFFFKKDKEETNKDKVQTFKAEDSNYILPNLDQVSIDSILYDFLDGSIGLHYDVESKLNFNLYGGFYAILYNSDAIDSLNKKIEEDSSYSETIDLYISKYSQNGYFPPLGTSVYCITTPKINCDIILNAINNIPESQIFKCGYGDYNYSIALISFSEVYTKDSEEKIASLDSTKRWGGLNITSYSYEKGNTEKRINSNGWPSEWLRRSYYIDYLNNVYQINNEFWDKHSLNSITKYNNVVIFNLDSKEVKKDLTVICENKDRFKVIIGDGNKDEDLKDINTLKEFILTEKELEQYLKYIRGD